MYFTLPGTSQFQIPQSVTAITIDLCGGGGGGGGSASLNGGGAGGFGSIDLSVVPGDIYFVGVGSGGGASGNGGASSFSGPAGYFTVSGGGAGNGAGGGSGGFFFPGGSPNSSLFANTISNQAQNGGEVLDLLAQNFQIFGKGGASGYGGGSSGGSQNAGPWGGGGGGGNDIPPGPIPTAGAPGLVRIFYVGP